MLIVIVSIFVGLKLNLILPSLNSPFECGFSPHANARLPFSLQFFIVALVFLVFDIELILLYPILAQEALLNPITLIMLLGVLILLRLGFILEWSQMALE